MRRSGIDMFFFQERMMMEAEPLRLLRRSALSLLPNLSRPLRWSSISTPVHVIMFQVWRFDLTDQLLGNLGEEGGLLGSAAIAANYKSANKAVKAMLQLDMVA